MADMAIEGNDVNAQSTSHKQDFDNISNLDAGDNVLNDVYLAATEGLLASLMTKNLSGEVGGITSVGDVMPILNKPIENTELEAAMLTSRVSTSKGHGFKRPALI